MNLQTKIPCKELYLESKGEIDNKNDIYRWYDLDEYKKLRKNPEAFNTFVDFFLSMVTGKTEHLQKKSLKLLQNYITESDEAFTLLLLEINWDNWVNALERRRSQHDPETDLPIQRGKLVVQRGIDRAVAGASGGGVSVRRTQ